MSCQVIHGPLFACRPVRWHVKVIPSITWGAAFSAARPLCMACFCECCFRCWLRGFDCMSWVVLYSMLYEGYNRTRFHPPPQKKEATQVIHVLQGAPASLSLFVRITACYSPPRAWRFGVSLRIFLEGLGFRV